jgi:hypothetical protein
MSAQLLAEPLERRICFAGDGGVDTVFVPVVDNPYLPLIPGATYIYRGADAAGRPLRSRVTVVGGTTVIDGVATTVARERRYVDGQLTSDVRQHFAQDAEGNVWRFDGNSRQIFMPVREGGSESARERVRVPFGTFADCAASDVDGSTQHYAPGIGLVMSQPQQPRAAAGDVLRLAYLSLTPESFADKVDNPYLPLTPGTTLIYRGVDNGTPVRSRMTVSAEKALITGVATTVVRVREYEGGELFEDTRDYYAQDKAGNVWYFGEDSRQYEDGDIIGAEGSWMTGVDHAQPGIVMRSHPTVGDRYQMEFSPGIAQDQAEVLARGLDVKVPYGSMRDALQVLDFNLLEPDDVENKFYVPGIGLVLEVAEGGEDTENLKLAYVLIEEPH